MHPAVRVGVVAAVLGSSAGDSGTLPEGWRAETTAIGERMPPSEAPRFDGHRLVRPDAFDEWPLAGASLGLAYSPGGAAGGVRSETFHRVYVNPASYRSFLRHGTFPEGTTFVLELYEQADALALPARRGRYEGRRVALEASVKDRERFQSGWGYFDFGNGAQRTAEPFDSATCHSCHVEHARADSVFVQFYPRLRDALDARR
jgi:hypothetical protein